MWSRVGLQLIVRKGIFFRVMSMLQAVNYQSPCGRRLDMTERLRQVFPYADRVTFLQCYIDVPHNKAPWTNPVSGVLACCDVLHPASTKKMTHDRDIYLKTMNWNTKCMTGRSHLRMEYVMSFTSDHEILDTGCIRGEELFNSDSLWVLLQK